MMSLVISSLFLLPLAGAFPPADTSVSINEFTGSASICRYCLCDSHTSTVTCASTNIRLKVVTLPPWAETFHAHNMTIYDFPHFTYHTNLKILRVNYCQLRRLHPLSFIPLPNLETIHLSDNELDSVPETLLRRMTRLRILNLARNKIENLDYLDWSLPEGIVLEQLVLTGNSIRLGISATPKTLWPLTRQLHLADTNLAGINSTHLIFKDSVLCPGHAGVEACRILPLTDAMWNVLQTFDLSGNHDLVIHSTALTRLANVTSLKLAQVQLPEAFLAWMESPATRCRHLDLRETRLAESSDRRQWHYCGPVLEWLDISSVGLERLEIPAHCGIKWLYAQNNGLLSVQIHGHELRSLYLDDNRIRKWPLQVTERTVAFPRLEILSLSNNSLEAIPPNGLHGLPLLDTLDLSHNNIQTIDDNAFPVVGVQLKFLNLSSNLLVTFGRPILPSLNVLDLSANDLAGLDPRLFRGTPSLQHLHLARNPEILDGGWLYAGADVPNLVELDLADCSLESMPELSGFTNLRSVNLQGNSLSYVDGTKLPACPARLNLRNNRLHFLSNLTTQKIECLKDLDLSLNPLNCDCSLSELSGILQHQNGYYDRNEYYCFADSWQHPLKAYLESADFCHTAEESRVLPTLMNFLGALSVFLTGVVISAFVVYKVCNALGVRVPTAFAYKPVPQADVVDL